MDDLISRQQAIEALDKYFDGLPIQGYYDMVQLINNIEPESGEWIYTQVREYPIGYDETKCSRCGFSMRSNPHERFRLAEEVLKFKFCPNCGKKMKVNNMLKSE